VGEANRSKPRRTSPEDKKLFNRDDHRVDGLPAIKLGKNRYYNLIRAFVKRAGWGPKPPGGREDVVMEREKASLIYSGRHPEPTQLHPYLGHF